MWTLLLLSFASVKSLALTAPLDRTVRVVPCTKTSGVDMMWKLLPQMDPSTFKVVVNASGSNATMLCLDCGDCNVNTIPKLLPCSSSSRTQPQSKSSSQLWVLKNSTAGPRYSCDRSDPTKGPQCVPAESGSYSASQCNEVCTNPTRLTLPAVRPAPAPAAVVLQSLAATPPSKTCIAVGGSDYTLGPTVTMVECDQPTTSNAPDYQQRQAWSFVPSPPSLLSSPSSMGAIRSDGGGCCGDIFLTKPFCLSVSDDYPAGCGSGSPLPFCNTTLSPHERVVDMISRMTLDEKAANLDAANPGVPRLGIPSLIFGEALHAVNSGCGATVPLSPTENNTGCATVFPQVVGLGATFNRSMWTAVGEAVSDEVRGLFSQDGVSWHAGLFLWTPNVNPGRDARWGRIQEVPSEDAFLCGEYAMHYIAALQGPTPETHLKTVATVKHWSDYDQEGDPDESNPTSRMNFVANVSKLDQAPYFWSPFRAAVQGGGVQSVMCSYNAVENASGFGVPSCANSLFNNVLLRERWGFDDGLIVSDCDAINDGAMKTFVETYYKRNVSKLAAPVLQAFAGINGGTDLDCGAIYGEDAAAAVETGLLNEVQIDQSLTRLYTKAIKLGLLDGEDGRPGGPYASLGPANVDTAANRELAFLAAKESLVLLKNDNNFLPLSMSSSSSSSSRSSVRKKRTIAIVGPHFNSTTDILGNPGYRGTNMLVFNRSPLQELQRRFPQTNIDNTLLREPGTEIIYAQGCPISHPAAAGAIEEAAALVGKADVVFLFLGLNSEVEDESLDRLTLALPGDQNALVNAVIEAAKGPIVAVLINGGMVAIPTLKESEKVPAIVEGFYPGQAGSAAIFEAIFGEFSPSGALPATVYNTDMEEKRSVRDLKLRGNGGITYMHYLGTPLWEFGEGLTYTSFEVSKEAGLTTPQPTSVATVTTTAMAASFPAYFASRGSKPTPAAFTVTLKNVGAFNSGCVVLGFLQYPKGLPQSPPLQRMFDFARVQELAPGDHATVRLSIPAQVLALTDSAGSEILLPGNYSVVIRTSNLAEHRVVQTLVVTGPPITLSTFPSY